MSKKTTVEPQYNPCLTLRDERGFSRFGLMSNYVWNDDPKRLAFMLSRYKFVAKMLAGTKHVCEIGCADAFGTRLVRREVSELTAVDFDPVFLEDAQNASDERWPITFLLHDMLAGPVPGNFDGAYSLDVLEHISTKHEAQFVENIVRSLSPNGRLIIGSPSLESQTYASPPSKAGHVNCKTGPELKALMEKYFHNVFIFSMNDEVVHTGFTPMAHYLFALCCTLKA